MMMAMMDVEAATLRLPSLPRVCVEASTAADRGCGAAGGRGGVGRYGGKDTSTAATEADCCHCLVVTVDGSTGADGGGSGAATSINGRRGGSTRCLRRCGQTWWQRHFDCRRGGGLLPLPRCHCRRKQRICGAVDKRGCSDTSTAATEADCCHCLLSPSTGSTGADG